MPKNCPIPRGRYPEMTYKPASKEAGVMQRAVEDFLNTKVPILMQMLVPGKDGHLQTHENKPVTSWEEHREAILRYWEYQILPGDGDHWYGVLYKRVNSASIACGSKLWRLEKMREADARIVAEKGFSSIPALDDKIAGLFQQEPESESVSNE